MPLRRYPMPAYPTSWYRVAQSDAVRGGELTTVHYFDRDLVLYRGNDGQPRAFDAHCPHLGAHLGHGGKVEGDDVICPFHWWRFSAGGTCTEIPYSTARIPNRASLRSYPAAELNGVIAVFWDPDGRAPSWDVPTIDDYDDTEAWTERHWKTWHIKTHVQEVFENGPDAVHQRSVHSAVEWPESGAEADGIAFHGYFSGKYEAGDGLPLPEVSQRTEYSDYGLGFTHLQMTLDYEGLILERQIQFCLTPVDDEHIDATLSTRGKRIGDVEVDKAIDEAVTFHTWRSFEEDIPIWEHKIYRSIPAQDRGDREIDSAVFIDNDRDISRLRAWARQFYPENSGV